MIVANFIKATRDNLLLIVRQRMVEMQHGLERHDTGCPQRGRESTSHQGAQAQFRVAAGCVMPKLRPMG